MADSGKAAEQAHYSGLARFFHWLTVLLVFVLIPTGLLMTYRGKELNVWDDLTNGLYSTHKLVGVVLLAVVVLRLVYRIGNGAPADEPTLTTFHSIMSHATHWGLYMVLLVLPILGWLGVSMFPALDVFGLFKLPALVAPDKAMSETVLWFHALFGVMLMIVLAMHIGAAFYHHAIRKDGVLRRMIPGLKQK